MANPVCPDRTIDSNTTGLAIAEEACPGILPGEEGYPGTPIWRSQEPNGYSDFGGSVTLTTRNPINPSRQNQKGVVTDLDASGGFSQDFTLGNSLRRVEEFFYARMREKPNTLPLNGTAKAISAVASDTGYAVAGADTLGFKSGHIVLASGFANAGNNGRKVLTGASATALKADGLVAEAAPVSWAALKVVGYRFAAGVASLLAPVGDLDRLTISAGKFSDIAGLIPGEWIYIGGDSAGSRFSVTGFARIKSVTDTLLIFDKVDWTSGTADAGSAKTIEIYFGDIIKNEKDPALIMHRSVQLRRTLGKDVDGVQGEYLKGAFANQMTLTLPRAGKITTDLTYVAMTSETRTGLQGLKPGVEVDVDKQDAFNTANDLTRVKLAKVNPVNGNPEPLVAFVSDLTITINNNVAMAKALGYLGSFSQRAGNFVVGGNFNGYFASVAAVQAVRDNATVSIDIVAVKNNRGMIWDIPALSLGGGRVQVEQDQSIMIPLENNAYESDFGHTLQFQAFSYLPTIAGQ